MVSFFDIVSSFHQLTVHIDTIPLAASRALMRLSEWLVMLQGGSAAPGWFVKAPSEAVKGLNNVAAYLNDVIVFDPDPADHVPTSRSFSSGCRRTTSSYHPRRRISAPQTDVNSLGHITYYDGILPPRQQG